MQLHDGMSAKVGFGNTTTPSSGPGSVECIREYILSVVAYRFVCETNGSIDIIESPDFSFLVTDPSGPSGAIVYVLTENEGDEVADETTLVFVFIISDEKGDRNAVLVSSVAGIPVSLGFIPSSVGWIALIVLFGIIGASVSQDKDVPVL